MGCVTIAGKRDTILVVKNKHLKRFISPFLMYHIAWRLQIEITTGQEDMQHEYIYIYMLEH